MSVKRRGGEDDANYFYRFTYKGHDFCEGGFRTKAQAEESERLAKNKAILQIQHPDDYAGEMTFRQAGEWWIKFRIPEKRSGKGDIGMLNLAIDYFDKQLIREIEPEHIDEFLSELQELRNAGREGRRQYNVGVHTRNHYRALLHSIYERLRFKRMYKGQNPVEFVDKIKVPVIRCRFIYPAEEKILTPAVAKEPAIFAYYRLGLETSMRIGEMRALRIKHVDLTLRQIFIPHPKNDRSRYVPLDDALVGFCGSLMAGNGADDYLMPRWSYSYILEHFKAICDAAEIKLAKGEALHLWRHTYAYNYLAKGGSLPKLSKLMGHSSTDVTEKHYGHMAAKDLRDAMESVSPFLSCNRFATAEKIMESSNQNQVEK